jgi:hypothetical protein
MLASRGASRTACPRDGGQERRFRAWIVDGAKGQPHEPENRARGKRPDAAVEPLELDLAALDHDQRVAPFKAAVGVAPQRGDPEHAKLEPCGRRAFEQGEAFAPRHLGCLTAPRA